MFLVVTLLLQILLPPEIHPKSGLGSVQFINTKPACSGASDQSHRRNISNIIFKREFKELSHAHSIPQTYPTDTLSNMGTYLLIHIHDVPTALMIIPNSGEDYLHMVSQRTVASGQHDALDS